MPISNPPQVRVIYAECNSPDDGSQDGTPGYLFDTFYDKSMTDITASKTTALAAMGLTYDGVNGEFTATVPMVLSVTVSLTPDNTPGGACTVDLYAPNYGIDASLAIANPNSLADTLLSRTFPIAVGGGIPGNTFTLRSVCANGTDTPFSYAVLEIVRLV